MLFHALFMSLMDILLTSEKKAPTGASQEQPHSVFANDQTQRSGLVQSGMASSLRKNASDLMLGYPSVPVGAFFSDVKASRSITWRVNFEGLWLFYGGGDFWARDRAQS